MNAQVRFLEQLERYKGDPLFLAERLLTEINEEICRLMNEQGVSRAELARRLGVSRQLITRMLHGNANMTIMTLVKVATALNTRTCIAFTSLAETRPRRRRPAVAAASSPAVVAL